MNHVVVHYLERSHSGAGEAKLVLVGSEINDLRGLSVLGSVGLDTMMQEYRCQTIFTHSKR